MRSAAVPSLVERVAGKLLGFDDLHKTYEQVRAGSPEDLPERLLEFLHVSYRATPGDLNLFPRSGAAVVVANHPHGIVEAAILLTLLRRIRPDVRVLANDLLRSIPELDDIILPIDVTGGGARANVRGLRQAVRHLESGGMLLVFPAGAVSHFHWRERTSIDPPWRTDVCRLIEIVSRHGLSCSVTPVFVPGSNSRLFHAAGMMHASLRTALLARELLNKRGREVEVRVGRPVPAPRLLAIRGNDERIAYLRWRTYLLAQRQAFKPRTSVPLAAGAGTPPVEVIAGESSEILAAEIEQLPASALLKRSGDFEVYMAEAAQIPHVLREIGRLRELTFRGVGEGTGNAVDLDAFDGHYKHLFVWNARAREVAGAYRLTGTDEGHSLYTQSLFQFGDGFLNTMGPALELGRSFVRAEYQRSFTPLLLLWQGIGTFVARNARYKMLFGPVSISNRYRAVSRDLMLGFLDRWASVPEWSRLVQPNNPPSRPRGGIVCRDIDDLSDAVSDLEGEAAGVPVLLRQYLRLGGRLLGFTVDPAFSNSLDGLIAVDLTRTEPKLLTRYLGKDESARFLEFHRRESNDAHKDVLDRELDAAGDHRGDPVTDAVL